MTSVREINILLSMHHENIVNVSEIVTSAKNEVYMVMEYVQQDLKHFMDRYKSKLKISEVRRMYALLECGLECGLLDSCFWNWRGAAIGSAPLAYSLVCARSGCFF